jgi:hypothetical protein
MMSNLDRRNNVRFVVLTTIMFYSNEIKNLKSLNISNS